MRYLFDQCPAFLYPVVLPKTLYERRLSAVGRQHDARLAISRQGQLVTASSCHLEADGTKSSEPGSLLDRDCREQIG